MGIKRKSQLSEKKTNKDRDRVQMHHHLALHDLIDGEAKIKHPIGLDRQQALKI
jgi:hypothetical protein